MRTQHDRRRILCLALALLWFAWPAWAKLEVRSPDDATFVSRVEDCKKTYRAMGGPAAGVLETLEDSDRTHVIQNSGDQGTKTGKNNSSPHDVHDANAVDVMQDGTRGTGRGSGSTVNVDPDIGVKHPTLGDGSPVDFCLVLLHELTHSYDNDRGKRDPRRDPATNVKQAEINAVTIENLYRAHAGLRQRTHYGGDRMPASAFTYPKAALEAERDRILALIKASNDALPAFDAAAKEVQEAAATVSDGLTQLRALEAAVPPEVDARARALMAPVEQAAAEARAAIQALPPWAETVADGADQACDLARYHRESGDTDLLEGARFQLQRTEDAFAALEQSAQAMTDALRRVQAASRTAQTELDALYASQDQALQERLQAARELAETVRAAAQRAEAATARAAERLQPVVKPGGEARAAAPRFGGRVDDLVFVFKDIDAAKTAELNAMKAAVNAALGTLRDEAAAAAMDQTLPDASLQAARQAQEAAALLEQSVPPQPDAARALLGAVADEMTAATLVIAGAERNLQRARGCLQGLTAGLPLSGGVSDAETGDPIAGASVTMSGDASGSAITDAGGGFALAGPGLNQQVRLNVSAPGYQGQFKTVKIVSESPFVGVALEPDACRTPDGAPAPPEACLATLRGSVVDRETGQPIAGASVEAEGQQTVSGAGGGFALSGLPLDAVVTVSAAAQGYDAVSRPVRLSGPETGVTLALTAEIQAMTVHFSPPDPGARQGVSVTVSIVPRRANVLLRARVYGTDGYFADHTLATNANGSIGFFVPGAAEGVKDIVIAELLGRGMEVRDGYVF